MGLMEIVRRQFHHPQGVMGRLVTFIMNKQNNFQYLAIEKALDLETLSSEEKVLDIGFGNGYVLQRFLRKYKGQFYGIDISADMVNACQKRNLSDVQTGRLVAEAGAVENMPFSENTFDKIYTINTSYFWHSLEEGFSEIYRCLKAGGTFCLAFYSKEMLDTLSVAKTGYAKYELAAYREAGSAQGFSVAETAVVPGKAYVFTYTKNR